MGRAISDPTRIAAIIAAYNEARNICGVLDVLHQVSLLDEILVVNDGSKDGTGAEVLHAASEDSRIRLITHPVNRGKGQAVFTGWENTQANILLLLDADLIALKSSHVLDLIRPVLEGRADMTMGLFRKGKFNTDLGHILTPWLTGQRCLYREMLAHVSEPAAAGYGLETAMTVAASMEGWRVQQVRLEGVYHPSSEFHRGLLHGIAVRARMYAQILRAWVLAGGVQSLLGKFQLGQARPSKMPGEKDYRHG